MKWLDRRIAHPGPYLTLCLNEKDFATAMRHCKIKQPPAFVISESAQASTHYLFNDKGARVCVVTMRDWEGRDPVEVAGLLVHEAVHVWQEYCLGIGERAPATEQEAYGVQAIAQELMAEFARQLAKRSGT